MAKYLMRLDDACEWRNLEKWNRMEVLLDKYLVKPIVAVIPNCEDSNLKKYDNDDSFWERAKKWDEKGWILALHGYNHKYTNFDVRGLNPVNFYSEFTGIPLREQKEKITKGMEQFHIHGLNPKVFVAPAHNFDKNTLSALESCSDIRIISDTIAIDVYYKYGFFFIPQQCGIFRRLPFKIVTGCYHPNTMDEKAFKNLESFIMQNANNFISFELCNFKMRKRSLLDNLINILFKCLRKFTRRKYYDQL